MSPRFHCTYPIKNLIRYLCAMCLAAGFLLQPVQSLANHTVQISSADKAETLLNSLSPEERVGQLFLITFSGMDILLDSPITRLIENYHIGGVILLPENENFLERDDPLNEIIQMNRQIQLTRWSASQENSPTPLSGDTPDRHYIPLFIGVEPGGNTYPQVTQIPGLSALPNLMALGATWNPELATQAGTVLGSELSKLGFNMLLDPALDVLEQPQPERLSDLGTRSLGGDPYWVGLMGQAYISGLHQGSEEKLAVIAKHFPGNGGADRSPEEEVATVRKSLEQLKSFDLAPFYAVTGNAPDQASTVEGLLNSHIRYQGFQENIRATTRPVSFDPQAFSLLMSLAPLDAWRQNGGVIVSDNLGSRAVRRFYELTGQDFDARRIAINAFLAGNDLLYLGDMSTPNSPDPAETIQQTIDFFAQKYREDAAFAQRVDASVLRILTLKYNLYPSFNLAVTLPALDGIATIGNNTQIGFEIARQGATLVSPSLADLDTTLSDPPNQTDRLVIISDTRDVQLCANCQEQTILDPLALRQAIIRLYGPQTGNLIIPNNIKTYTNSELIQFLNGESESVPIESDLRRAHWVIFAILDVNTNPNSQALLRFLAERPDLLQQKRIIVFGFDAPYFLDATTISKLTAYYALYSYTPNFIDVAARLLFRELQPLGDLPVSVSGIGYDLISATSPDPNQIIPLYLEEPNQTSDPATATIVPQPTPEYRVGNLISVYSGVILDHNGHPVPDGTPVSFIMSVAGEINGVPVVSTTSAGIASATMQVQRSGLLEIRVESEPAKQSGVLRFDIPAENGTEIPPTPTAENSTSTPVPTPTPTPPQPTELPTGAAPPPSRPNIIDWIMATLVASVIGLIAYRLTAQIGLVRWGVRAGFLALIGGLVAYTNLTVEWGGSVQILERFGSGGVIGITAVGCVFGLLATWVWRFLANQTRPG